MKLTLTLLSGLTSTSHCTGPDFSPLQLASIVPSPALLTSNPKVRGDPNSRVADGSEMTVTLLAPDRNVLILNGLPFTCCPAHITLTSYVSGSGGVKEILYLSLSDDVTVTGTSPALFPMHVATNSPPPAAEASKSRSTGAPDSTTVSGFARTLTLSATGGSRLILKGEPGTGAPDHFTSTL